MVMCLKCLFLYVSRAGASRDARSVLCRFWSDLGHFQTSSASELGPLVPSTADMRQLHRHVGFVL
jgi:hypothetical protein